MESLASLADIVVFSAAVPFKTGPNHINEQWPSYWAERFAKAGMVAIDCLRPVLWDSEDVADYCIQNVIVYAMESKVPTLRTTVQPAPPKAMIHPGSWEYAHRTPAPPGVSGLPAYIKFHASQVGRSLSRAVRTRL